MARAKISLPVPGSPSSSTKGFKEAALDGIIVGNQDLRGHAASLARNSPAAPLARLG
jgi:hypothetical protein